jgi:LacI family transcriptional regulator
MVHLIALIVVARAVSARDGLECCASVLERCPSCTAIVTTHYDLAAGCLQALSAAGRGCHHDVSVAGFGDLRFASCLTPGLTTVGATQYQIGKQSAQMLVDWIGDPAVRPAAQLVRPELTIHASTGPAPESPAAARGELMPAAGA